MHDWRKFLISHPNTPRFVCEAPSEGAAVEFWMACHGMFGYDEPPSVTVADKRTVAHENETTFRKIMGDPATWLSLNEHHTWKEKEPRHA